MEQANYELNNHHFSVVSTYEEVINSINEPVDEYDEEMFLPLDEPSGMGKVLLCSDWPYKFRLVDFSNTTNRQAIKKILTFYKHKTYRRGIGDHIFFEGFMIGDNVFYDMFEDKTQYPIIMLGS
jgi:hypothetical protein